MPKNYGATPEAWAHFDLVLGLGEYLLPVAANPHRKIAPTSTLTSIGKVPSRYDINGNVCGISKWAEKRATPKELELWSKNPDYGICLQTHYARAIDVDVPDPDEASAIRCILEKNVKGSYRIRKDSSKFLTLFICEGEHPKRTMKTKHGIIEFLASGQQCVVDSMHPDGCRYEWEGGLPSDLPVIDIERFDRIWNLLAERFAVEEPQSASLSGKKAKLEQSILNDPVAAALNEQGYVLKQEPTGRLAITCPFEDGHSTGSSITSTVYFPAHTGGYEQGHFDCKHASCSHRTDEEFQEALGISIADDFDVLGDEDTPQKTEKSTGRFEFVHCSEFIRGEPLKWIIKGVLPQAELGMIYGPSGSGKTFFVLDMIAAIARGVEWRGCRVTQGSVAYIASEGAGGVKNRIRGYGVGHGVEIDSIPLYVLGNAPNLMERKDTRGIGEALNMLGTFSVIVVDTYAASMPGGDENSGKDAGRVLANCRELHKATGAMVLMVHHTGKDTTKGARGWSGLRAALDFEMEIERTGQDRIASITKLKDGQDEGIDWGFSLKPIGLGIFDEDDDEVRSCVVETQYLPPVGERKKPITGREGELLDSIINFNDITDEWPTVAEVLGMDGSRYLEKLKDKRQVVEEEGRIIIPDRRGSEDE